MKSDNETLACKLAKDALEIDPMRGVHWYVG